MRFTPLFVQPIGLPNIEMLNWELRSGIYYGDFRTSALDNDPRFMSDRTQIAVLGTSNITPATNFGKSYSFCIADPKQDLAVLVDDEQPSSNSVQFHFHSLTTGQPHRLAEHPILTVNFDTAFLSEYGLLDELISADPEIMGNYLIVNLKWLEMDSYISETLLWNWKSGVLLARIQSENSTSRHAFLNSSYFLIYSALPNNDDRGTRLALSIFPIPKVTQDHKVPPRAHFCPSSYPKCIPVLILELPELLSYYRITGQYFSLNLDQPGNVVYSRSATLVCSHPTTLSLSFQTLSSRSRTPYNLGIGRFTVFISTHPIFAYLREPRLESTVPRTIPWGQWGTTATRWFSNDLSGHPYRSHCVLSAETKSTDGQLLSIVDFNAPVTKRHEYNSATASRPKRMAANKYQMTMVLEGKGISEDHLSRARLGSTKLSLPLSGQAMNHEIATEMIGRDMKTVISVGFKDPVVSSLPYRVVTKLQRMPPHGHWRTHGEYLIGFPRRILALDENQPLSLYKLEFPTQE
ncbi:hypothetical protein RSOLAG1IB_08422 [Rhizoctonia solani AG-1 IB]|uniref:Uncharacterized protein n=1 Tax=Thanatephorus cucumeris (strain AG1-IB / isolate 7/3/14) TaxID=1108050 RepID=A0A0B7FJX3_THACB|nr:hypothetical protein RSOLAG1IB_08422 [Rhizoctonia solani AG-1 IB]